MRALLRSSLVTVTLALTAAAPKAFAWGSPGHMAVAAVAWKHLDADKQARVQALLKLNPNYQTWMSYIPTGTSDANTQLYLFMMAATWPDEIKATGSGYHSDGPDNGDTPPSDFDAASANTGYTDTAQHKYWHFVNKALSPDNTAPDGIPTPDATTEIVLLRTAIGSDEPDALKSYDLVWLEHLVGDVHQPLHCAIRFIGGTGDGGGNSVAVNGNPNELHAYWDDLPGKGVTKNYSVAIKFLATLKPTKGDVTDTNVENWVQESFDLANSDAYTAPVGVGLGPYTLTTTYHSQAYADAQVRIELAGERLAYLLNNNLQ